MEDGIMNTKEKNEILEKAANNLNVEPENLVNSIKKLQKDIMKMKKERDKLCF
jgi:hypothetical protein